MKNTRQKDSRNSVVAPPVSVREDGKFLHKDPCKFIPKFSTERCTVNIYCCGRRLS